MAAGWISGSLWALVLAVLPFRADGQVSSGVQGQGSTHSSLTDELRSMTKAASAIFTGTVVSVKRIEGEGGGPGVVEIRFSIDKAVQGCTAGSVYTLREWGGLWAGGVERYRVGQRMLMLLRPAGAGGLSSPVGGQDGALPLFRAAEPDRLSSDSLSPAAVKDPEQVDLRWISARVQRPVVYRSVTQRTSAVAARVAAPGMEQAVSAGGYGAGQSVSVPVSGGDTPAARAESAPLDAVVSMLRQWQGETAGAH